MFELVLTHDYLFAYMLVFLRVGLLLLFFPIFGDEYNPRVVKVLFAAALALVLTPLVNLRDVAPPRDLLQLGWLMLPEVFFALAVGFSARLIFETINAAGEFAGLQMGFLTANQVNPANQAQTSLVGQFWQLAAILIFFGINGHHVFIQALRYSFEAAPPFQAQLHGGLLQLINRYVAQTFYVAAQLSAPIVVAMILVNVCLGLANKVVPSMHVFMESFPIRILLGLGMLMALSGATFILFERLLRGMAGQITAVMNFV